MIHPPKKKKTPPNTSRHIGHQYGPIGLCSIAAIGAGIIGLRTFRGYQKTGYCYEDAANAATGAVKATERSNEQAREMAQTELEKS